jgi:succinoglycan biosynthesis protein ExoL
MPDLVVMVVTNPVVSDPRVEKEAAALVAAGYAVTILAWDRAGDAAEREERNGYVIERLGPRGPYGGGVRSLPRFREFWRGATSRAIELKPAVVHCHDMDTATVGLAVVRRSSGKVRLVVDNHELYRDSNMMPKRGAVSVAARLAVRALERRAFRAADAILVANPGTEDYYAKLGFAEKTVVVENAPDHEMFAFRSERRSGPFTIGYFGQKRYIDGLLMLIEVVRGNEELHAILAGGGTCADQVADAAAGIDRIEATGRFHYDELPDMYQRCDAVYAVYDAVLGNVKTLFPVKVMEAMACGLPVIVASGTWIAEYVQRHELGFAVPVGDRGALEDAVAALVNDRDEAAAMGRRGRAIVEAGLSWRSAAGRLTGVYSELS